MKTIEVVAAIILYNNQIFCAQRKYSDKEYASFKFEFPGGKVEEGETNTQALIREIKEELSWEITPCSLFTTVEYPYSDFNLLMHCYICKVDTLGFTLNEHLSYRWLNREDLLCLDWAAADSIVVKELMAKENL
ncbi:(deoxy)nucleoside triphosphate pyrophosphohydrolase [Myroides sp. LJL115]